MYHHAGSTSADNLRPQAYFLLGVELTEPKTVNTVAPGGSVTTANVPGIARFSSLNGIETFRPSTPGGVTQWANLTLDDVVFNAVNSCKHIQPSPSLPHLKPRMTTKTTC